MEFVSSRPATACCLVEGPGLEPGLAIFFRTRVICSWGPARKSGSATTYTNLLILTMTGRRHRLRSLQRR